MTSLAAHCGLTERSLKLVPLLTAKPFCYSHGTEKEACGLLSQLDADGQYETCTNLLSLTRLQGSEGYDKILSWNAKLMSQPGQHVNNVLTAAMRLTEPNFAGSQTLSRFIPCRQRCNAVR